MSTNYFGTGSVDSSVLGNTTMQNTLPSSISDQAKATSAHEHEEKHFDDYMFQFFIGSISVVGLFVLFRIIQKSK